jgi:hypothetical protein
MEYKIGQAAITEYGDVAFITEQTKTTYNYVMLRWSDIRFSVGKKKFKRPATEAEILAEIQKHGWKQKTSKWLYASPSGQLELMNNDGWQPIIYRQPLPDQFEFFGNQCIQAARILKALNLANV